MNVLMLTPKQRIAYDAIIEGKNVFITGPSGTGKSLIINTLRQTFGSYKNIAVTSTTGISALLIGGTTLHSFLGIGLGQGSVEELLKKIMKNKRAKKRWIETNILIIDEISMLSPDLFDKLEQIGRIIRSDKRLMVENPVAQLPFGGLQIVLSGDFLQLPVVGTEKFCFEAESWNRVVEHTVYLQDIMRQTDVEFQSVLMDLRYGYMSERAKKLLKSRINANLTNDLGIKPTRIFTTNAAVDDMNEKELDNLAENNEFYEYTMSIMFHEFVQNQNEALEKCKKSCLAPEKLQLCVGAQVMLLTNLDLESGLANGSRGVVVSFHEDLPMIRFLNGTERLIDYHDWELEEGGTRYVTISQVPLKLAWAVTVHKCQGCTLDYAEVDLGNLFTYGQGYVALSRVKRQEGLNIVDIDFGKIKAHPKAIAFYKKLDENMEIPKVKKIAHSAAKNSDTPPPPYSV